MTTPVLQSILYVDDNPYQQVIFKAALSSLGGYTVRTSVAGLQALYVAADFVPDLLLLNVDTMGMDGTETLEDLRTVPGMAKVPVIFITDQAAEHDIAYFCALGAIGVICKSFGPFELMRQVNRLWEHNEWPVAATLQ